MNKKEEKQIEKLTDQLVVLLDKVHQLELTLSRLKNEGEELLRNLIASNPPRKMRSHA